ncbi:50S ribosomal protein L5 [Candidatus Peregrinibacteria bacterium]|nr:50S ribosomal protein L5 [Candidatus Peregrinibacteria bacterium]
MSFQETFKTQIAPTLQKEFNLPSRMAVPRVTAVKVHVGIGSLLKKTKDYSDVISNIAKIAGQKPVVTKAKKAISNFKLREGMPVGIMVTLRGNRMYEFLYRLVNIALPRVRDFRGLSPKAFDGHGNYTIGFKEAIVFPEINPDDVLNVHGMQITIVTTAGDDQKGRALLTHLGFPFKK